MPEGARAGQPMLVPVPAAAGPAIEGLGVEGFRGLGFEGLGFGV